MKAYSNMIAAGAPAARDMYMDRKRTNPAGKSSGSSNPLPYANALSLASTLRLKE